MGDLHLCFADVAFAGEDRAIHQLSLKLQRLHRHRQHTSAEMEDLVHATDRFLEIAVDVGERHHHQIAEAVALEPFAAGKAIVEKLLHDIFFVGQRHNAGADIPHWDAAKFAAQSSAGATVVADGNHRCEIRRVVLEPLEDHRQPCAAADHHDLWPAGQHLILQIGVELRMALGDL